MKIKTLLLIASLSVIISGCKDDTSTQEDKSQEKPVTVTSGTGLLIDSSVTGVNFRSGDIVGVTGNNGEFRYEIINGSPSDITFSFGKIPLGTTKGQPIVTPLDFFPNATIESQGVKNLIRFLMMLDNDSDASNGIEIYDEIVSMTDAYDWLPIDFTDSSFENQSALIQVISDVSSLVSIPLVLPDELVAINHFSSSARCLISGTYFGDFSGDDHGPIALGIDPNTSEVGGIAWSRLNSIGIGIPISTTPVMLESSFPFSSVSDSQSIFSGNITGYENINGKWVNEQFNTSGDFSASKMANDKDARYKFTGTFLAEIPSVGLVPIGLLVINISSDNTVSGSLVDIILSISVEVPLTGTLNGTLLSLSGDNGISINGLVNFDKLTITGAWANSNYNIQSGFVDAIGCQLNL